MNPHPIPVLLYEIIQELRARKPQRPALIGVGGAQGSGKSYQCRLLAMANQPRFAHFSLDDVYLTKSQRERRADIMAVDRSTLAPGAALDRPSLSQARLRDIFVTRGPPGTHDLALAEALMVRLGKPLPTPLPRFDKTRDDRAPEETWPVFQGPAEAILLDGWCMGALPPPDGDALNAIEETDVQSWRGENLRPWRGGIEHELKSAYAQFFARFDALIYLQAPSWEVVRVWRGQQEAQTLGRSLTPQENAALDRFMMHYERVTRAMLAGRHSAKWIVHLDEQRNVVRIEERN